MFFGHFSFKRNDRSLCFPSEGGTMGCGEAQHDPAFQPSPLPMPCQKRFGSWPSVHNRDVAKKTNTIQACLRGGNGLLLISQLSVSQILLALPGFSYQENKLFLMVRSSRIELQHRFIYEIHELYPKSNAGLCSTKMGKI